MAEGGVGGYDIWVSQRDSADGPWGPPVCLDLPINTTLHEAGPSLSRDGHWLFFQRSRTEVFNEFDLVASYRERTDDDFGWQVPFNLGEYVNAEANEAGPVFFEGDETCVEGKEATEGRRGGEAAGAGGRLMLPTGTRWKRSPTPASLCSCSA